MQPASYRAVLPRSIGCIQIGPDHRDTDPAVVTKLVDSIKAIGLQSPIAVSRAGRGMFNLVTGRHRLAAYIQLGLSEIPARIFADPIDARLWAISENLHRAELTALQRAEAEAAWIEAMEQREAERREAISGQLRRITIG